MKLSLEIQTTKSTIETEYTPALMEMVEHMYRLCLGAGFSPLGTADAFLEHGKEILEAENIQ